MTGWHQMVGNDHKGKALGFILMADAHTLQYVPKRFLVPSVFFGLEAAGASILKIAALIWRAWVQ